MKLRQQIKLKQKVILTQSLKQQINLLSLPSKIIREKALDLFEELIKEAKSPKKKFQLNLFLDSFSSNDQTKELSEDKDLRDHLMQQLNETVKYGFKHLIGEYIIDSIDDSGKLDPEIDFNDLKNLIYEEYNVKISKLDIEESINNIQLMNPIGCGFRTTLETLLFQLKNLDLNKKEKEKIKKELLALWKSKIKFSMLPLQSQNIIKKLNPEPGWVIGSNQDIYIKPEIKFHNTKNGWTSTLIDSGISDSLIRELKSNLANIKDKDKREAGKAFLYGIEARNNSLLLISQIIANHQKDFLNKKIPFLKPLILSDIAAELKIHQSTISRIVTNKYVQLPGKVILLKSLLSKGLGKKLNGKQVSVDELKASILKIIKNETPRKFLSDKNISQILNKDYGLIIARRTITKYRLRLNIPSSTSRKLKQITLPA